MRLGVFVYYAEKLLNILDATSGIVGVFRFKDTNKSRLVYDGLNHLAKIAGIAWASWMSATNSAMALRVAERI